MKTILVTGASHGIGKCMVEEFAKEGNNVILNYNKSEKAAKQIQEELKEKGHIIEIYKADVSKRKDVQKLIKFVINKFGKIDVLINNAGIAKMHMFSDVTDEEWEEIIDTNLKSVFYCSQEVLPYMVHEKDGCIINISSVWGMVGASCESIYSISKAGIDAMTKSLAKEFGPSNIRINSIAPGVINTKMNSELDKKIKEQIIQETPLQKIGEPIDIYKCAKWLVEDKFTTGQIISPNGGWIIN